jgi:hypothetical protein
MLTTSIDRYYLTTGLVYGILGLGLGIYMAATRDHGQLVTHAHLMLVGFLLSIVYALIHRLWLERPGRLMNGLQFGAHHLGTVMMVTGLYLLYGGHVPHDNLEPVLASASIMVLIAMVLITVQVLIPARRQTVARPAETTAQA